MAPKSPLDSTIVRHLCLLATTFAVVLGAQAALASARYDSTVTINLEKGNPAHAFGHVRSDVRNCKNHRKVILLNETAGTHIGHFVTGTRGVWRLEIPKHLKGSGHGHFVDLSARVLPRKTPHLTCGRARAGTIPVAD